MLGGIVESFFSKIGEQLADYAHNTMSNINDFHSILDSLQRNLKSLSAKALDVEEQIKIAEISGKKKRKREVEYWLTDVQMIENEFLELENEVQLEGFVGRFLGGDRVARLNERVDKLVEQSRHFGEPVLDVYQTRGETLLTTRLEGKAFAKNLERILKMLVVDKVSSIGIYGMGGVGKTTLTKHIHNQLLKKTQETVCWVTVSQEISIKMLQDKIAHAIGNLDLSGEHDEDKRAAKLNRALSMKKNIVLILDDVWNDINLEKMGDPLGVEGCRLIITTRSLKVCHQMRCQQTVEVQILLPNEAWNLFRETLGGETKLSPQVEDIAKSMVKVCDGLPLGVITLAGSMRGETDIHVWKNELAKLQKSVMEQDDMEDKVFKVLEYSFDRLVPYNHRKGNSNGHTPLQLCFLYCSLYPEDFSIRREELVRNFISEGLVDEKKRRIAQIDEGHSTLSKLVNVSLLESTAQGYDVKMHDLVRAMALKITQGKNMVIAGHSSSLRVVPNEEEWTTGLEKMSLMHNGIKEIPDGMSPNCPKLSTLLLNGNEYLEVLPHPFFTKMHGLCNLDLSGTKIQKLPNSLSELGSLKTLILRSCLWLTHVPYLGKLEALRELDLTETAIKELPQGTENLANLKCLWMVMMFDLESEKLPTGILLNFPRIQFLHLPMKIEAPVKGMESLKELEEFVGRVKDVGDFNQFIRATQGRECNTCYDIQIGSTMGGHDHRSHRDYRNVVTFYQYDLKKREERDLNVLAESIQHLVFQKCACLRNSLLDNFLRFNNPTSLKSVKIEECKGIKCIVTKAQLKMAPQVIQSTLEEIELRNMEDFMGVVYLRGGAAAISASSPRQAVFSSLKSLMIYGCDKMKKLGLPAVSDLFPNLERISVENCSEIEEIITVGAEDVDQNGIRTGLVDVVTLSFPKLKHLSLSQLPELKSICKVPMICSSIKTITLFNCPALKKVPIFNFPECATTSTDDLQPCSVCSAPPTLKLISVDVELWESLELDHPTHSHLLEPFLEFL